MAGGIFHIDERGELVEMTEAAYDSEGLLQGLLERHPALLAGDQISSDAPRRWLLVRREVGVPDQENGHDRWAVDHLFLDQDAIPTFVEVKRSTDTRIRREVVGQMLDYAANAVVYWPVERIQSEFEAACKQQQEDPEEKLAEFLDDQQSPGEFWQRARTHLQAGRLRLLFVADRIPAELRRVVEFLNGQMERTEVLAVEIKQYVGSGGGRTLVPRVLGQTASAESAKENVRAPGRAWNESSFIEDLSAKVGEVATDVARRLIAWSREEVGEPTWGNGSTRGFFTVGFDCHGFRHVLFDVWTNGNVSIRFMRLKKKSTAFRAEAARIDLMNRLNRIEGVKIREPEGWPNFRLELLASDGAMQHFLDTIRGVVREIKDAEAGSADAA